MEAFWWLADIPADHRQRHVRSFNKHIPEEERDSPVARPVQYLGRPSLQVRSRLPLPPLGGTEEKGGRQATPLAMESREPRARQCAYRFRHGTNINGEWGRVDEDDGVGWGNGSFREPFACSVKIASFWYIVILLLLVCCAMLCSVIFLTCSITFASRYFR